MKGWYTPCGRVVHITCKDGSRTVLGWHTLCARVAYAVHKSVLLVCNASMHCVQRLHTLHARDVYVVCTHYA